MLVIENNTHKLQPASSHTHRPQPAPSQEPLPSQCVQYGELELFLLGQQLGDLLPLFRQCKVQFSDLMSLTETDLDMVCVCGWWAYVGGWMCVSVPVHVLVSLATLTLLVCQWFIQSVHASLMNVQANIYQQFFPLKLFCSYIKDTSDPPPSDGSDSAQLQEEANGCHHWGAPETMGDAQNLQPAVWENHQVCEWVVWVVCVWVGGWCGWCGCLNVQYMQNTNVIVAFYIH